MANDIALVAHLEAYRIGKAMPASSHQLLAIHSDALVIAPIAMAGEDASIHAVALGRIGDVPEIRCVPDPRKKDDQYNLFSELGMRFDTYFHACRDAGTYPQLWVSSSAATILIDILAEKLRYEHGYPEVRMLGECLTYFADRYPIAGQQSLIPATSALRRHWISGEPSGGDDHLSVLMNWISPGITEGESLLDANALLRKIPMGTRTPSLFDRETLAPLVEAYNSMVREEFNEKLIEIFRNLVCDSISPVAGRIYTEIQRAIMQIALMGRPMLPSLPNMERAEIDAFRSFMDYRDGGMFLPRRDSAKSATLKLCGRENAQANYQAALVIEDGFELARSRRSGRVLKGVIMEQDIFREESGVLAFHVIVGSSQRVLGIRRGDELSWKDDPRLSFSVTSVSKTGKNTHVGLRVISGMRSVGVPKVGHEIELVKAVPDWGSERIARLKICKRLATIPMTHMTGPLPSADPPTNHTGDPLAALEDLR